MTCYAAGLTLLEIPGIGGFQLKDVSDTLLGGVRISSVATCVAGIVGLVRLACACAGATFAGILCAAPILQLKVDTIKMALGPSMAEMIAEAVEGSSVPFGGWLLAGCGVAGIVLSLLFVNGAKTR
ncbi:MAG: hypothetical protein R3F11_14865 [Verrucomicrobiales bacterium]